MACFIDVALLANARTNVEGARGFGQEVAVSEAGEEAGEDGGGRFLEVRDHFGKKRECRIERRESERRKKKKEKEGK